MNKKLKKNNKFRPQVIRDTSELIPKETLNPPAAKEKIIVKESQSISEAKLVEVSSKNEVKAYEDLEKAISSNSDINEVKPSKPPIKKAAKTVSESPNNDIKIFQIYFEPWQKDLLDNRFIPVDNSKSISELREVEVFSRLSQSDFIKGARLWGALSWRFTEKTGMTGQDLLKEISSFPDQDVYFCNPEPEYEALYHNLWLQGIPSHPQFIEVCQAFFQAVGLPVENLISIESVTMTSSANYFIASPKFWALYLPWIQNLLNTANKKMSPTMRDLLHSNLADEKNLHGGSTYLPFIIERLLPLFLKTVGSSLKAHKLNMLEPLKKMDVHLRLLREMKDVAHRTNSAWLAACWVNYRNLYLTQTKGVNWCKSYLRQITPEKIIF